MKLFGIKSTSFDNGSNIICMWSLTCLVVRCTLIAKLQILMSLSSGYIHPTGNGLVFHNCLELSYYNLQPIFFCQQKKIQKKRIF